MAATGRRSAEPAVPVAIERAIDIVADPFTTYDSSRFNVHIQVANVDEEPYEKTHLKASQEAEQTDLRAGLGHHIIA